jgi:hypothetical protein
MTLSLEITISDIISCVSVLVVIIGGWFAYYQWRKNIFLKRADYINELTEKIRTDEFIKSTIYDIEYNTPWYSKEFHHGGENELRIDKTLSYFSYICYLKKQRIITNREFHFFKYEIMRILVNPQIQDYFYNLYHFANKFNVPHTFKYLFEYGEKNKFFDDDFYDRNSYQTNRKYHRNINF